MQTLNEAAGSHTAQEIREDVKQAAKNTADKAVEIHNSEPARHLRRQAWNAAKKGVEISQDAWNSEPARQVRQGVKSGMELASDKVIELASRPETRKYKVKARQVMHQARQTAQSEPVQEMTRQAKEGISSLVRGVFGDSDVLEGEFSEHHDPEES